MLRSCRAAGPVCSCFCPSLATLQTTVSPIGARRKAATDVDHTATRPFILRACPPARVHISVAAVRQRPGHSAFADELGWTVTGRSPYGCSYSMCMYRCSLSHTWQLYFRTVQPRERATRGSSEEPLKWWSCNCQAIVNVDIYKINLYFASVKKPLRITGERPVWCAKGQRRVLGCISTHDPRTGI